MAACQLEGQICILDIDVQGVRQIKSTPLNPRLVFIKPPSLDVLKERLVRRGTETEASLRRRLEAAQEEIDFGMEPGNVDLIIINDDFEAAYKQLADYLEEDLSQLKQIRSGAGDYV